MVYSGNINDYLDAMEKWTSEGYMVDITNGVVRVSKNSRDFITKNFFKEPNGTDEDVFYMMVSAWLRKNYEAYKTWH